ncbi:uncharacterized protein LOC122345119 [Puntigrus tetrazona]|uniref:uncharacterized protein LOC122345119 n=1 Tax=Puntigrus tetrazona TaxID=1606681 RepID=UPI001C8ABA74|nr:uncharacterized protein LOC122345119 [Puntigrus tetrazona]
MSRIILRSKAKGSDICAINKCYYIIRSDLGCYMKTNDLNKGADISIFSLHPACQNGDHYIGGDSYFHIINGNSCRRVTNLTTDGKAVVYSLHPNCQGGDHYFAAHVYFYIIFREKGIYRRATNMTKDTDAEVHPLHPNIRAGLNYWGPPNSKQMASPSLSLPQSGVEFCTGPDLSTEEQTTVFSVHPDVLNFLPGGLSVTKGPATGMWENIKTITNDSSTPVTWQKKITKKVGYNKEKMDQITHNRKIDASVSIESGELAKLIAKSQLSFSAEYGGSHINTENESWKEATEEEEHSFKLKRSSCHFCAQTVSWTRASFVSQT